MLTHLIDLLHKLALDPTPEEIGDMLWLADHLDAPDQQARERADQSRPINPQAPVYHAQTAPEPQTPLPESAPAPPSPAQQPVETEGPDAKLYSNQTQAEELSANPNKGLNFRTPGVSALPGTLELARALRPFKRPILSRTQRIFDEQATIKAAADSSNHIPILCPAPGRWLDVLLIVDESSSMGIWRATIQELQRLLERQGAFRNVQLWSLQYASESSEPRLQSGAGSVRDQRAHKASELIDPTRQRLILIVTDCVSPAWDRTSIATLIKTWEAWGPVALIQMLPQYLWHRTALGDLPAVHLRARLPGLPNAQLDVKWLFADYDATLREWLQSPANQRAGVVVPVVTLEPRPLATWATALATGDNAWIAGYFLPTSPLPSPLADDFDSTPDPSAEQLDGQSDEQPDARALVENFYKQASPTARKLARHLAAAPLTLPVMRLVQGVMLPDSRQIHLAEVFLSGLLERQTPENTNVELDAVHYEFVDGVRNELLGANRASATIDVLAAVSKFIGERAGQPLDFRAWLAAPTGAGDSEMIQASRHFALITSKVLLHMGGQYTKLALRLEVKLSKVSTLVTANWKTHSQDRLRTIAYSLRTMTPGLTYSAFSIAVIAQDHSIAAGAHGIAIGGDVDGPIATGDNASITYIRAVYLQAPGTAALTATAFDQAVNRYLAWVIQRYGQLNLRGIERREHKSLTLTLADVYVSLSAAVAPDRQKQRQTRHTANALDEAHTASIDMAQLLSLGPRLMIVGGPGSGKTTYLHIIASALAHALHTGANAAVQAALGLTTPLPLPILISLSEYNAYRRQHSHTTDPRQGTLLAFITHTLIRQEAAISLPTDFFERLFIQQRACILLLDGLDEVADERERSLVRQAVENVASNAGIRQLVVTCRTHAYQGQAVLSEDFRVAEVQPMTSEQIVALAARWSAAVYPAWEAEHETSRLQAAIAHLEQVRAHRNESLLVDSPLLLTIVAIGHYNQRRLPEDRAELYEKCLEVLLAEQHHLVSQTNFALADRGGSLGEKRNLLAHVAYQLMSAGEAAGHSATEVQLLAWLRPQLVRKRGEDQADAELATFVQAMRERGSLLDERGGVYRFIHLTFQEFLCAYYLAETVREIDKIVAFLATANRIADPWWRETVLLTVGYLGLRSQDNALALVRQLAAIEGDEAAVPLAAAELAASALLELAGQDSATSHNLVNRLLNLLGDPALVVPGPLRGSAGVALGRLGDPRPGVGVKAGLPDLDWVQVEPGPFIMGSDKTVDEAAYVDEQPQFIYTLIRQSYNISRYPITVAQYQTFIDAGGYTQAHYWTAAGWTWCTEHQITGPEIYDGVYQTPNHPQVGVSWYEAVAFCAWLSEQIGQAIRLPTEPEWERAARYTDGRIYPWSNPGAPTQHCNMGGTGIGATSAVGIFPTDIAVCGAADMAGNVSEWTYSLWGTELEKPDYGYPYQADNGRENPEAPVTVRRVLRGGSFSFTYHGVRCAYRDRKGPVDRDVYVGFRVLSPGP